MGGSSVRSNPGRFFLHQELQSELKSMIIIQKRLRMARDYRVSANTYQTKTSTE